MFKTKHKLVQELVKAFPDSIVMQRKRHDGQVVILIQRSYMKTVYMPTNEVWESDYDPATIKGIINTIKDMPQHVDTYYEEEVVERGSTSI